MNRYPWIEEYANSLKGVEQEYKIEWQAIRFLIGSKMFILMGTEKSGREIITLKLKPENGLLLRESYKEVIPGYYMNKVHWNSVFLDGDMPDDILKKMIQESYELVLKGLTKKQKAEALKED